MLWEVIVLPKKKCVQTQKGDIGAVVELLGVGRVSARTLALSPHCSRETVLPCAKNEAGA